MLNKIKFSYREADKQERLITPNHTLFKCKIKVDGVQYTFNYQCNTNYTEPNLLDCIYAIFSDMNAYDGCDGIQDFYDEFGYSNIKDAEKAYKACKKTAKALNRMFSKDEIIEIFKELEEEGF